MSRAFTITTTTRVSMERVYDLLITGMECGSYATMTITDGSWGDALDRMDAGNVNAFDKVCVRVREDVDPDAHDDGGCWLTDWALQVGLQTLADEEPHLFQDFLEDREDAITGDAFLQAVVLGEVIYG